MARIPPHDLDAEEAWLGAAMIRSEVAVDLEPEDFYREAHRLIFRAVRFLRRQGQVPDGVLVAAELNRRGLLADAGGHHYVHALIAGVPVAANAPHYAEIIRRHSKARSVLEALTIAAVALYDHAEPADVLADLLAALPVAPQD